MRNKNKKSFALVLGVFSLVVGGFLATSSQNLQGRLVVQGESANLKVVESSTAGVGFSVVGELSDVRHVVLRGPSTEGWLPGVYSNSAQDSEVMNAGEDFTVYPFLERNGLYMIDERIDLTKGDFRLELWENRQLVEELDV